MRVKCLAENTTQCPRPGLEPRPFDPETSALTMRPPRLCTKQIANQTASSSFNFISLRFFCSDVYSQMKILEFVRDDPNVIAAQSWYLELFEPCTKLPLN